MPAGLALAQQKALCTTTRLLLLSQRHSRRRGSSGVGRPGAGLTGGVEREEEFGRRGGLVVESETVVNSSDQSCEWRENSWEELVRA